MDLCLTVPDDEQVGLLVGVEVSERRHRPVVLRSKQIGGDILESDRTEGSHDTEQAQDRETPQSRDAPGAHLQHPQHLQTTTLTGAAHCTAGALYVRAQHTSI